MSGSMAEPATAWVVAGPPGAGSGESVMIMSVIMATRVSGYAVRARLLSQRHAGQPVEVAGWIRSS